MTVKQLEYRIKQTKAALDRERSKNIEIVSRVGWGSGMRRVRIGPSYRRQNELESRLRGYIKQLNEIQNEQEVV